jgi:transcriptional regulator
MYLPRIFATEDAALARRIVTEHPFASLVGVSEGGAPEIAHAPLLLGGEDRLVGHVARANPFAGLVQKAAPVTAVFHGPDAYVSASWYAAPDEQVPTWNYAVVYAEGTLRELDTTELTAMLAALSARFEADEPRPWRPEDADPGLLADLQRAIVGFELRVTRLQAKLKLSQNRASVDRARVEAKLAASDSPRDREVAVWMARALSNER